MNLIKSQRIKNKITHTTFSKHIKLLVNGQCYVRPTKRDGMKPDGIWLSVDNGWEDWCKGEDFMLDRDAQLQVQLKDDLEILVIDSMENFLTWMHEFEAYNEVDKTKMYNKEGFGIGYATFNPHLWAWTASKCDGIFVTDKGQWATRMDTFLYGWDCASICMFDPTHIKFHNPKVWITQTDDCNSCKGKGTINFGKLMDDFPSVKSLKLPKPPAMMYKDTQCAHCGGDGKVTRIVN